MNFKGCKQDNRPFGQLLGDCIKDSINSMLLVADSWYCFQLLLESLLPGLINIINPFSGNHFKGI